MKVNRALTHMGGRPMQLRCRGKVVRVNRQKAKSSVGVAATIERYQFVASG